jgi:hypothetical protein
LEPDGKLIIAEIAVKNKSLLDTVKCITVDSWEDKFYWLATAVFHRILSCTGVFKING